DAAIVSELPTNCHVLFTHCTRPHTNLHSFPTRRSSDLEIKRYQKIISNKDAILQDAQSKADNIIEDTKKQVKEMVKESEVMQQRSEEHTSELQSRFDLVCRLLLEKKKK